MKTRTDVEGEQARHKGGGDRRSITPAIEWPRSNEPLGVTRKQIEELAKLAAVEHGVDEALSARIAMSTAAGAAELFIRRGSEISVPNTRPVVVQLSQVETEEVRWLWEPYIARGKVTLLEGDPGLGKTWVALAIASTLSRGRYWPLGGKADLGCTLYISAEDGVADTLRPRADAAGADPQMLYALTGVIRVNPETGEEVEQGGISVGDVVSIEQALSEYRPALVVVDPIQGFLGAGIDMHRANEVRPVLSQLSRWAEKYDCAFLLIRHLSKSPAARGIYRGLGSIDFTAAARSVLLAGQDPQSGQRSLVHLKSSLAPIGTSIDYDLTKGTFRWIGLSKATAETLLAPERSPTGEDEAGRSALEEAIDWLRQLLGEQAMPVEELQKSAKRDGLSWRTIERAKSSLKVVSNRRKAAEDHAGKWVWSLPASSASSEIGGLGGLSIHQSAQGFAEDRQHRQLDIADDVHEVVGPELFVGGEAA